jgi:hypothetical protein
MKYLKLFESFYYGSKDRSKKRVEEILSEWGSELEDLEDLFIWFSDFGYEVELKVQTYGIITKKQRIIVAIENIKDTRDPEILRQARKIITGLPKIGLYCESPESYESSNIMLFSITPA